MKSNMTTNTKRAKSKVAIFEETERKLHDYMNENFQIFNEYEHLVREYNRTLEDAEKEVRALGKGEGPFVPVGQQVNIDVDRLYEELGEEHFLKFGGIIETKVVFNVDREKFERFADGGVIPKEVLDICYEKKPRFKVPKKLIMP